MGEGEIRVLGAISQALPRMKPCILMGIAFYWAAIYLSIYFILLKRRMTATATYYTPR